MKFKMLDGSIYEVNDESWIKAIRIRKKPDSKVWDKAFAEAVKIYFDSKTMPNKFGAIYPNGEKWDKNYKNHADLAPVILYLQLRAILMGMMMSNLGGGKVVAMSKDGGVTEYPSGRRFKNAEDAIKAKR